MAIRLALPIRTGNILPLKVSVAKKTVLFLESGLPSLTRLIQGELLVSSIPNSYSALASVSRQTKVKPENPVSFEVYVDEEFQNVKKTTNEIKPAVTMRQKIENGRTHSSSSTTSKTSESSSRSSRQVCLRPYSHSYPTKQVSTTSNDPAPESVESLRSNKPRLESGRMEKSMYDREVAWTKAGGEISIEELRAMVRYSYSNPKVAIPIDCNNTPEMWKCRRVAPKPVQKPKPEPVVVPKPKSQPPVSSQVSFLRGLLFFL